MKRNINLLLTLFLLITLQQACTHDSSTLDTTVISEISIDFGYYEREEINIDMHEVLTIDPTISQSAEELELTYEWEVDQELHSTDKVFEYTGEHLGTYLVRLKVSNKHGSEFKIFKVRVNSPYEEGLLVLSNDDSQQGSLTFIRKEEDKNISDVNMDDVTPFVYKLNNDDTLGKEVTDVVKRVGQFFISSAGDASIKVVNTQTFEMEAGITAPEFSDFKPHTLNIPDNTAKSGLVLTTNGNIYEVSTSEHLILPKNLFGPEVDLELKSQCIGGMNFTMNYFWDNNESRLWNIWYTNSSSLDKFQGQELVQFFATETNTYALTKEPGTDNYFKTVFGPYIQEFMAQPLDITEEVAFTNSSTLLTKEAPALLDDKLFKLVYAVDNKVYRWYYSGVEIGEPPYITIDTPGVITSLAKNPKGNELFVAVYDSSASGRKGSVYVFNIDTGRELAKFEGISDKVVKMLYKNRD